MAGCYKTGGYIPGTMSIQHASALRDLPAADDGAAVDGSARFGASLKTVVFRSLSWTSAARAVAAIGVVVRYVTFARLLSPFDFGVIASANLCLILGSALTNTYVEAALVAQHDDIMPYLDTVWVTMVTQGLVVGLAVMATAQPLARFFGIPGAYGVFLAVSALPLVRSLRSPASSSRIYRKMDFRVSFVLTAVEQGGGFLCGLCAILWFGDWRGLVVAMYGETIARCLATYWYFPYRPCFSFDVARFRRMFTFGRWVTIGALAGDLSHQLDNLVVGHLLGAKALGEYQMAFRLGEMCGTEIGAVVGLVTFPLVSRIGNERSQRWRLFAWTSGGVGLLGALYALFLLRFGAPLVTMTVGAKWLGALPVLRILCFYGLAQGLIIVGNHFLDGLGKPKCSFRIILITTLALGLLIYPLTAYFGSVGAATAAVAAVILPLPVMFKLCWDASSKSTASPTTHGAKAWQGEETI